MNNLNSEITGILGGLGPDTTAKFYLDLVHEATEEERPALCIWNLPLNLKKEEGFVKFGQHREHYRELLFDGLKRLEKMGSTQIVIPCNTVHEFHPELAKATDLRFPNLIDIVAAEVKRRAWEKVLLLATSRTVETGLYQNSLEGVDLITPEHEDQKKLDEIIMGLLGNREDEVNQDFLKRLMRQMGIENAILGCTDLQLSFAPSDTVIDSMQCLVRHLVGRC